MPTPFFLLHFFWTILHVSCENPKRKSNEHKNKTILLNQHFLLLLSVKKIFQRTFVVGYLCKSLCLEFIEVL